MRNARRDLLMPGVLGHASCVGVRSFGSWARL